jgi:hypothetical protein
MDLEHAAGVVGAAIGQRKVAVDTGTAAMTTLVLPFRAELGRHPSDVAQDVAKLVTELHSRVRNSRVPSGVPSATLGRRLIGNGAQGSGENWRAGAGAAALSAMTYAQMEAAALGFDRGEAMLLVRLLEALAAQSVV